MSHKNLEKARKAELKAAIKESGLDRKTFRQMFDLAGYGGHELLDRSQMLSAIVDDFVMTHPSALLNPELYEQAAKASRALAKLHEMVSDLTK